MIRALTLLLLLCGAPAHAALTQAQLGRVRVDLPKDAALDLHLNLPAVLIFADFDCPQLCDAVLGETLGVMDETGLKAGKDYRLVVVRLDPRDSAAMGEAFLARQSPPEMRPAITLLTPDAAALGRMTRALGYGYVFDADHDNFAHPAARYVLNRDGRVTAVRPAFDTDPAAMRAALVGARFGTGGAATQLILLCYGFDPVTGRYSLAIWRVLVTLSTITMLILACAIGVALIRERRRA